MVISEPQAEAAALEVAAGAVEDEEEEEGVHLVSLWFSRTTRQAFLTFQVTLFILVAEAPGAKAAREVKADEEDRADGAVK